MYMCECCIKMLLDKKKIYKMFKMRLQTFSFKWTVVWLEYETKQIVTTEKTFSNLFHGIIHAYVGYVR